MGVFQIAAGVCLGLIAFYIFACLVGVAFVYPNTYPHLWSAFANLFAVLFRPFWAEKDELFLLGLAAIGAWYWISRQQFRRRRLWNILVYLTFWGVSLTGRLGIGLFLLFGLPAIMWVTGRVMISRERRQAIQGEASRQID